MSVSLVNPTPPSPALTKPNRPATARGRRRSPVALPESLLITFEEWLEMYNEKDDVELVNGKVIKRMAAQYDHEKFFGWMLSVVRLYAEENDLGEVLGSRSAVKINDYNGRLPDVLFVKAERADIIQQKALYAAPDWVLEIVSPEDRPGALKRLAKDYISIGVPEIWFVDLPKQQLRVLRDANQYEAETVADDATIAPDALPGLRLRAEWLLREPRPKVSAVLRDLT